jgi:aspartyl-tRNA(Asn)/glutamyl-tRNA(Gln) amidotransferase subunit A
MDAGTDTAAADPAGAWRLGASALAGAYARRETTPTAVLAACLARLDAVNPALNAVVAQRREAAAADAAASAGRHARGAPLSPLDGVPVLVKDNLPTADLPTTWGSAGLKDHRPPRDELCVARLRAAGAVIVGKTNVPEFTLEGYTHNPLFGTTRNPFDLRLTPGGSSGGSVAAVAAGIAPLALGTDGGGSTRRPASHTGLVGFKPSIGAVARVDALPPLLLDFEVVGPIARSVADVRLLFDALRGPHPADRASRLSTPPSAWPARLRVLHVAALGDAPVDPQIDAACRAGADRLRALGHEVVAGPLPLDLGFMTERWASVGQIGLGWLFGQRPDWHDGASPAFQGMAAAGLAQPAPVLWDILQRVARLRQEADALFEGFDLVTMPSAAALPWPAEQPYPTTIGGREAGPRGHAVFTGWVNAAGLPAVSMPCAPSAEGLPIGLQLIAGFGRDDDLLDLAAAFERSGPAWRWPAL